MAVIKLTLRSFDSMDDATRVADEIREAGAVRYEDGPEFEVSEVTVEATVES